MRCCSSSAGLDARMNRLGRGLRSCAECLGGWRLLAAVALLAIALPALADDTASSPPAVSLLVEPAEIVLGGGNRGQTVLVTATSADGQSFDVTHDCELRLHDA